MITEILYTQIAICIAFLVYASYSDLKTHLVSNDVWILMIGLGVALNFYHIGSGMLNPFIYIGIMAFAYAFAMFCFYIMRQGGADSKAYLSIGIALPLYPTHELLLLNIMFLKTFFISCYIGVVIFFLCYWNKESDIPIYEQRFPFMPSILLGFLFSLLL